ncbi:MAG TPA: peptidylprolyl isomerase [Verrucomicrobiae bacterium]|jgi:parvulin-like peptidyl-prolyl isomerase|nr:peptidylprolyl isomerase [Verrucomicrobiae bacterium]
MKWFSTQEQLNKFCGYLNLTRESGLFEFWRRFGSVAGLCGPSPSPKPCQNSKILASNGHRISLIALVAVISVFGGLSARADLISGISVVVDDAVITYAEIETEVNKGAPAAQQMYANDPQKFDAEIQRLRSQGIELLVEDKLILHEFTAAAYATNVLEAFIDDEINDQIHKRFFDDRTRLIQTLQAENKTYEDYRREQREDFIIRYMKSQNASSLHKILISPLKIQEYYDSHKDDYKVEDQIHLRMIVIPQDKDDPPGTAKKMAEEILAKIDSGVPFAEMAGVNSSGSQRSEGGDRGWVSRTDYKPELASAMFSLKAGQHSGVIDLPEACYLMMADDTRPAHIKAELEVRDEIERILSSQESIKLYKQWIERLKRKSFIEYY